MCLQLGNDRPGRAGPRTRRRDIDTDPGRRELEPEMDRLILVTNDDGLYAPGLQSLAAAAVALGEVAVVAPDRNQSGASHMISLHQPLRGHEVTAQRWVVQGSPADSVYLAIHELLPRRPDLVLSGINAGANLSFDVHYSGTVGSAMEGTLMGVPSIAVSLTDPEASDFEAAGRFAVRLAAHVLEHGLPEDTMLNVNVPPGEADRYQMTFLGHRVFRHQVERRDDPRGAPYYWIGGRPTPARDLPGSDCNAVAAGWVSVTPLTVDATHRGMLAEGDARWRLPGLHQVEGPPDPRPVLPRFR
jgi:5'-nucleotidase